MIKRLILIVAVIFSASAAAQENISSPYSYYGIGLTKFKGTAENRSMGGLSVYSDSIHLNLRNPAGYGKLRRTTYSLGAGHEQNSIESSRESGTVRNTSLDYLALGVPVGKFGFGMGVMPYTSVGYRILDIRDEVASRLSGRGGMNRVFLSAGYEIIPSLSFGVEAQYNFGNFQNRRTLVREDIQLGTQDVSRSNLQGFSYNLGLDFQRRITSNLNLHASATYAPEANLSAENMRNISTVAFTAQGELPVQSRELAVPDSEFTLPSRYSFGLGLGRVNKWFLGGEYAQTGASEYISRFNVQNESAVYNEAAQYKLGGYFIPQYNSLTSYWKRVVYRAGFRFEETGLNLNNQAVNEFGITFGLGVPVGPGFSNLNLGFEYGQRGTLDAGLVKEDFFRISLGVSLTEARKWFERRRFN